jgi:membrane-bound lytic murein transglycosylase D
MRNLSKLRVSYCLAAFLCLLGAVGCDDTAKHAVQVRPPEIKPAPEQATPPSRRAVLSSLPLPSRPVGLIEPAPPSGVDSILSYAMWAFEAGQQDFRAGHLTKARQDFDLAVDTLLGSGLDLKSDPRLLAAFQRIVNTVSSQEFAAFREGDGFSELKAEAAPIDQIPEIGVPAPGSLDPKLAASAERELAGLPHDFPLTVNEYVLVYLNFFQTPRGRAIVETGLRRAGRYRPMIEQVLDEEGLPHDLIYMAQAESAFQPTAVSKARAVGLWQFMSGRAREYGLHHTWWIDERQDPLKSTRAAAKHLHDLYDLFGDWYLAMAAYDSGPGNVQKAIERTGYADFWELYKRNVLPKETRNYVPIILALTLIAKDAGRYGIELTPEPVRMTDSVKPGRAIDLRLVAETIDVDVLELRALNPELLRMVTPNDPGYELRLPAGTAERFLAEIADIPQEKWVSWRLHRIEEGETLTEVARKFRVTAAAIADANGLDSHAPLPAGEKLIIPAVTGPDMALGKLTYYRVRKGDTVAGVAEEFSVTAEDIVKWNHLTGGRISRGMRLRVYPGGMATHFRAAAPGTSAPVTPTVVATAGPGPAAPPAAAVVHKVEPGETLWSIAKTYRTTAEALRAANKFLFTRPLQVGDQLMILPPH